nr:MAG TPA_asm: hypothetical protein [Caudoviricetes sp.]
MFCCDVATVISTQKCVLFLRPNASTAINSARPVTPMTMDQQQE